MWFRKLNSEYEIVEDGRKINRQPEDIVQYKRTMCEIGCMIA